MQRSITVLVGDHHAGERVAFRINGIDHSHTFRSDHDFAKGMTDLRDRIATALKSPPYSVGPIENVKMRFGDGTSADGIRLTFTSSWEKWPVELLNVESTESLNVLVDAESVVSA